jgi:hypothetical protein
MPVAYSYKRFSSDAQEGNDSIRRQTAAAKKFVDEHPEYGLVLDTTLSLVDAGVSAYRGRNIKEGALGVFIDAVKGGLIPMGSWLLLESFDRFTRQSVNIAANELLSLINKGIVVVTLHNQTIYREEDFTEGMEGVVNLMGAMIAMQGHHAEQVTKGKRVAEAWKANYEKINTSGGKHLVTRMAPFWLRANEDKTGFYVLEDRVEIVREIFRRRAAGEGKTKIANDLTARGVPTSKGRSTTWHPSAIQKLLSSDSVAGALVNNKGERFENYYPTIIEPELFQAVNALRQQPAATGLTSKAHPLTGLVKHDCGTTMRRINKGANAGGKPKFQCPKCRVGLPFNDALELVEQALFSSQYVAASSSKGEDILGLQGMIDGLSDELETAYAHWRRVKTVEARQQWNRLENEVAVMREELRQLQKSDTEVLLAIEEQALRRAAEHGSLIDCLRSVTIKVLFNADCSQIEMHTISGKKIIEYRINTI